MMTQHTNSIQEGHVMVETRSVRDDSDDLVIIRGRVMDADVDTGTIRFIASAPPDRRASFSGSGMPFASASQAFFNTPNQGQVALATDGTFEVRLAAHPNSYYAGIGTVLVPPCVHVMYTCRGVLHRAAIKVAEVGVPFRLLTYPSTRSGPEFYDVPEQLAMTQEAIFRASAFPTDNRQPSSFWQSKPSV